MPTDTFSSHCEISKAVKRIGILLSYLDEDTLLVGGLERYLKLVSISSLSSIQNTLR